MHIKRLLYIQHKQQKQKCLNANSVMIVIMDCCNVSAATCGTAANAEETLAIIG